MKLIKTMAILADIHCGHIAGLTPPKYFMDAQYRHIHEKFWKWYEKIALENKGIDILVVNGDAIDGKGEKSGGTEQICMDRKEQVEMAYECLKIWNAKKVYIQKGTSYHVGKEEDWEDVLANKFGCDAESQRFVDVKFGKEHIMFDFKHHIGSSSVQYGRHTAVARDKLWNSLQAESGNQPKSDWVVRSHVHYCVSNMHHVGSRQKWGITTPCLQLGGGKVGSKFGQLKCSGTVDVGLILFKFYDNGTYGHNIEILNIIDNNTVINKV